MLKPITLTLPMPPTINHYYGRNGKRTFVKDAGVRFRELVAEYCCHVIDEPISGRLSVSVTLHNGTNCLYDIDNRAKSLLDSLTLAAVWNDDSQVDELILKRGRKINGGMCVVEISQI